MNIDPNPDLTEDDLDIEDTLDYCCDLEGILEDSDLFLAPYTREMLSRVLFEAL